MAKIYRREDRIRLAVDDLEIVVSPLGLHQKAEIEEAAKGGSSSALMKASALAMKYSLKEITGLEDANGKEYRPAFGPDGNLEDETIDDLFNVEMSGKLIAVTLGLLNGVPSEYDIEGVKFITEKEPPRKKKRAASSN